MTNEHDRQAGGDLAPTEKQSVERRDTEIGAYRLLELLGRGAMGEVWRAEQREPVKRIVALKLILKGMDTREVITRFEIERQAMALMNHPWIAKVFDAGETNSGRPWIAMEFVAGEKITDYCHRNELSIEERLQLFQKVCLAVQHAHQNAVIHRDLKPGNILVTEVDGEPVPKIIDFGIAKATAQRLSDRSAATFVGQLIGTPLYMSPEQVEMSAAGVDTRADVYSLGVVLYELLAGVLPHDPERLAHAALNQVLKVLRESETPRPSTRVSTLGDRTAEVAARRKLNPAKLVGKLRGDLDWIVLKSLEKDRKRRYESPKDFAEDIGRYLDHDVVRARPPSVAYRFSRLVRRNRVAAGVTGVAALALLAFGAWQTYQNGVIARERDRAIANERLSLARGHLDSDPTSAMAYVISSLELLDQPSARRVALQAILSGPLRDELPGEKIPGNPLSVDVSMDGRLLAVCPSQTERPTMLIYDLVAKSQRVMESESGGFTWRGKFSRNGSYAGAIALDGLHVWRVSDGTRVVHHPGHWRNSSLMLHVGDEPSGFILSESAHQGRTRWYEIDPLKPARELIGESMGVWGADGESHAPSYAGGARVLDYDDNHVFIQDFTDFGTDRVLTVGYSEASVSAVALDPRGRFAVSVDIEGGVRVWDLSLDPPLLYREYDEKAGAYSLQFDPYGSRFITTWGGESSTLYDLAASPPRVPLILEDRVDWTHDGSFLPDGSIITCRNGSGTGELAHWRLQGPQAWSLGADHALQSSMHVIRSSDGAGLFTWAADGDLMYVPIVDDEGAVPRTIVSTNPWPTGIYSGFFLNGSDQRALAHSTAHESINVIDLVSGHARMLPVFEQTVIAQGISPSGRVAAFADIPDVGDTFGPIRIVDLDSGQVTATLGVGAPFFVQVHFLDDSNLLCLYPDHLVTLRIDQPQAAPDTLWIGDASRGGQFLSDGREVVVHRRDFNLILVDLEDGSESQLGEASRGTLISAAYSPDSSLLALALGRAGIQVFGLVSGDVWQIPQASDEDGATYVLFDRAGRHLISDLGGAKAWKLPLDPIFQSLQAGEFLDLCRARTNVRMVPDGSVETGYRISNLWGSKGE